MPCFQSGGLVLGKQLCWATAGKDAGAGVGEGGDAGAGEGGGKEAGAGAGTPSLTLPADLIHWFPNRR